MGTTGGVSDGIIGIMEGLVECGICGAVFWRVFAIVGCTHQIYGKGNVLVDVDSFIVMSVGGFYVDES